MHFFLHGGQARIDSEKNRTFFQHICRDGDKILVCLFASEKASWAERFVQYQDIFVKYNPDKTVSLTLASDDVPTFIEQIKYSSLLYFGGGQEDFLLTMMRNVPELRAVLEGKWVAGSSAGTNIWAKICYINDVEEVQEGLGILNIKTICHRGSNYSSKVSDEKKLEALEAYGEQLPIYKIPEQEYIEIEI